MRTNLARKVLASRIVTLSTVLLITGAALVLLRSAVAITVAETRKLNENIVANKQRIASLRNNIEKIMQFEGIAAEYEKIQRIPIDETVNLIKARANLFHIYNPVFKITKPAVAKKSQTDKLSFSFMSATISLQCEANNDIMLFAFLDDIINKINGGLVIESFSIMRPNKEEGSGDTKNVQITAVLRWDFLNLVRL